MSSAATEPIDKVWAAMTSLLDCLCTELAASPGGDPCFCGVVPAALVPMDYCDCDGPTCGMGWVRVDAQFPSRQFPSPALDARCGDPLAVRFDLGVTRCLPNMDARGNPPTLEQQLEATRIQIGDSTATRRAIACCYPSTKDYVLGNYTPVGGGTCGGGFWQVTVKVV